MSFNVIMGHTTLIARKRQFPKNLQNIDEANSNASIVAQGKRQSLRIREVQYAYGLLSTTTQKDSQETCRPTNSEDSLSLNPALEGNDGIP
jgi:hypothetical protein